MLVCDFAEVEACLDPHIADCLPWQGTPVLDVDQAVDRQRCRSQGHPKMAEMTNCMCCPSSASQLLGTMMVRWARLDFNGRITRLPSLAAKVFGSVPLSPVGKQTNRYSGHDTATTRCRIHETKSKHLRDSPKFSRLHG